MHVEAPYYPPIARTAHISGKVFLSITIDADGNVIGAEISTTKKSVPLLVSGSIRNIRHWIFVKPSAAPYKQTIEYDYEIDDHLPFTSPTQISFDLPGRVTLVTSAVQINTNQSTKN